ncbi:MAG: hypothetical protein AB7I35_21065 [Ramlibacter sp.]
MNAVTSRALALCLTLSVLPAHALYRCGNVFQDRPCDASGAVRAAPATVPSAPTPAATRKPPSAFTAVCARIGLDAQRFVWKREGGATLEQQMADLPNAHNRNELARTLESVYQHRGSAPEIRAAIEADCLVEKQKAADAAAALKNLQEAAARAPAAPVPPTGTAPGATAVRPPAVVDGKARCADLKRERDALLERGRAGGSAATMDSLNDQKRRVDAAMGEARC